jgi:hypothetical protein
MILFEVDVKKKLEKSVSTNLLLVVVSIYVGLNECKSFQAAAKEVLRRLSGYHSEI